VNFDFFIGGKNEAGRVLQMCILKYFRHIVAFDWYI